MVVKNPLSEQDLATARAELSAGRPFTVWFTSAAVGVAAGGSAKVISVGDVAEGDFIQVKPARSNDTMFCSPNELTTTRPPRKSPQPAAPVAEPTTAAVATPPPAPTPAPTPTPPPAPPKRPSPASRPASNRPAARPSELTVTLNATVDGEWTVEVLVGRKRTVRPTPVPPSDIAAAARSLPAEVAEAIESSLRVARQQQLERVERLRAELDAAQQTLQELSR